MMLKWDELLNEKLGFNSELTYASVMSILMGIEPKGLTLYKKVKTGELGVVITQGWAQA